MVKFHYPDHPFVGVGIVVWRGAEQSRQNKSAVALASEGEQTFLETPQVLLVRRKNPPAQGQWGLPGGKQQLGETIFEAAMREAREETGVEITPLGIITAVDAITRDAENKIEYHYTIIEVAAEAVTDELRADDDALEARWVAAEDVEFLCAWPEVARVVRLSMLQRVL